MVYKTESNKQTRQTNKPKLIDTDNSLVVTTGKGVGGEIDKNKGGQIYSDRRRFDFGW